MSRLEEMKEVSCFACHAEILWKDPMCIHNNKSYCRNCYLQVLRKENQRYKKELEEQLQAIFFTMVEVDNMKIKLERYKHALEFYANDENWVAGNWFTPVDIDQGEIAEKALACDNS